MNFLLWIVQILLALSFFMAGTMKLSLPIERLRANQGWVEDFPASFVRLVGSLETLGALGVLLPALSGILPWLTPLAAAGLAVLMGGATIVNLRRNEARPLISSAVLLLIALFVALGRFALVPLQS